MTYIITSHEICMETGLTVDTLIEVVEHGIVEPVIQNQQDMPEQWTFSANCLGTLQRATRLQNDLGLNWQGIALVLDLLEQRDQLKNENLALLRRLQRFEESDY